VNKYPFHSLQYSAFRYMNDFGVSSANYFQEMYTDIYPKETGICLIPNRVELKPNRLLECKVLHILIFVDSAGTTHVTLYNKREDYNFFVNRFPDIDSNVCRSQSISAFYGETLRLFRINTHSKGFFKNLFNTAAYLIRFKRYPAEELHAAFSRFLYTQVFNPRLMGIEKDLELIFKFKLDKKLETKGT
jgi:hypothetical protein